MRDQPICCECEEAIVDPVFESACGHDDCPSLCWHPQCLMAWRERRDQTQVIMMDLSEFMEQLSELFEQGDN